MAWGRTLMYHRWLLREIWLQSVSFSISRLHFANRDHIAHQYVHIVLYWSLAHNCGENQNNCIILLATQAQCAELLKWPTYGSFDDAYVLLLVMCATYPANIKVYLITEILLCVMYKSWHFSLRSFLRPSVTSSLLGPSIFLSEYTVVG